MRVVLFLQFVFGKDIVDVFSDGLLILLYVFLFQNSYILTSFCPFYLLLFLLFCPFPKFSPPLHFLLSDLPESLLRRICFVTPSNKGTQKRRKNEQGTKEERTKGVQKGDIGGVDGWKGFLKTKWRVDGAEEGVADDEK